MGRTMSLDLAQHLSTIMPAWKLSSLDQVGILLLLLGTAAFFGILKYLKETAVLRGFSGIATDVRVLCKLLRGKKSRDGKDLVIGGHYGGTPVLIRFSRTENVPELNIQMPADARCNLFIAPARARTVEGAARVQVTHPLLNSRCSVRTDQILEARALLQMRQVLDELWNMCCSCEAYLSIAHGKLELSESQLPTPETAGWVKRHLHSMALVAAACQGKAAPRAEVLQSAWARTPIWVAMTSTALLVIGLFTYVGAKSARVRAAASRPATPIFVSDIPSSVARQIPGAAGWRLAQPTDFDSRAVDWAGEQHASVSGVLEGKCTSGDSNDVAYVLVNADGSQKRIVLLSKGALRFDASLPQVALAARVPAGNISNIDWQAKPMSPADGDGILVLRDYDASASSIFIYCSGLRTLTALPRDYHRIGLE